MNTQTQPQDLYTFNGVDPSGAYYMKPLTTEQLFELALDEYRNTTIDEREKVTNLSEIKVSGKLGFDAPTHDPAQAGWGVIIHDSIRDSVKSEVEELIRHRANYYKIEPKEFVIQSGTSYLDFLADNGVSPGYGEVARVPYYLLIVGDPTLIPYRFQYELGTEYAVGRIAFSSKDGYRDYIQQLIDYENSKSVPTSRQAVFWATANQSDKPTELSASLLAGPLYEGFEAGADPQNKFTKQLYLADQAGQGATRANLVEIHSRPQPPALLFTASHGMVVQMDEAAEQLRLQGALITQEWKPGVPITPAMIYSGEDVMKGANVRGMVHFAFACFSAGTPYQDDYWYKNPYVSPVIASFPFISNLATQELCRGALAFIGHVDRAWGFSFANRSGESHIVGFERAIKYLLQRGWPVGYCLRDISDRALHLSKSLLEDFHDMGFGKRIPATEVASKWKERNDARAYAIIGDPAAHVRVADMT